MQRADWFKGDAWFTDQFGVKCSTGIFRLRTGKLVALFYDQYGNIHGELVNDRRDFISANEELGFSTNDIVAITGAKKIRYGFCWLKYKLDYYDLLKL
jgi:hypothetical protein